MKTKILILASAAFLTAASVPTQAATEVYNTEGTFNWVAPADVTEVQVECWGGGGSGGSGRKTNSTATNTSQNGGGGGGGAYARRDAVPVTPGVTYTVTIPAAAVSGANGTFGGNYSHGEDVTFVGDAGTTVTAAGGSGGQNAYANVNATVRGVGGAGGTVAASEGDVVFAGGNGAAGTTGSSSYSGGGGGGAGDASDGNNGVGKIGGVGGTSGGGTGGNGRGDGNTNEGPGGDGAAPSAGGGGAKNLGGGTKLGGIGSLGQVRISFPEVAATKADNADDLNLTTSWVGGEVPTGLATWDSTIVTGANTTVLGADLTMEGLVIKNPAGLVTINAGNTLTLNGVGTLVDMSAATADLILNCDLVLAGGSSWDVSTGNTATVGGAVSGGSGVTKLGDGTLILSGANTYAGDSSVVAGTLQLGAANVIPDGGSAGDVVIDGTLDLNGNSETINRLTGSGVVDNTGGAAATLTVDVGAASNFDGTLQNSGSALNLIKTGNSTFSLGGVNSYTGTTTVSGGTLSLGNVDALSTTTGLTLADGTLLQSTLDGAVINAPITLGDTGTNATISAPVTDPGNSTAVFLTLNGAIGGQGDVTFTSRIGSNRTNTILLNAQSTYAGDTLIDTSGTTATQVYVRLGVADALPTTTVLNLDGGSGAGSGRMLRFDMNGFDQTLAGLSNIVRGRRNQQVTNSGALATLTVNNADDYSFGGSTTFNFNGTRTTRASIQGAISLVKSGVGTFTLVETHTYTGDTTVNEGTLSLGAANSNNQSSTVTLADSGATLDLDFAGTDTVDQLFIGTTQMAAGEYKAVSSAATGTELAQLTGTGTLTVTTGPAGYATWAATNVGGEGPDLDFDKDGVQNGIEFFQNAAAGFTASPLPDGTNTITWPNGGNIAASEYGPTGQFVVQTSSDLETWTDVDMGDLTTNTDGPGGSLTYTLTGGSPRFVRLKVTPN